MIRYKFKLIIVLLAGCLWYACTDTRDEHYKRSGSLPDRNLRELIAAEAGLSVFSEVITIAGYDALLASSQTFTVWAPDNSALAGVDVSTLTKEEARLIVENHIARYNHSTSESSALAIRMKSNKVYSFSGGGTEFGGATLQQHDVLAKNGILHTLQSRIPYFPNIYEYILTSPHTSRMADFIRLFEEEIIDPRSIEADGSIRDTAYIRYNRLFDITGWWNWYGTIHTGLGQINVEDSIYTALIPDNKAWDAAYERIFPAFKAVRGNDSLQHLQTSLAIVEDLFFRGAISNPAASDSLISTSPGVMRQPDVLFGNTQKIQASNGLVFLAENTLNYDSRETWMKPVAVEADEQEGRKIGTNTTIVARILDGVNSGQATHSRFLEVYQTSPDAANDRQPRITFDIPQVLSGKYDIYVEFLPGELAQQGEPRATKLLCTLYYRNANGNSANTVYSNLQTSATEKIKLLIVKGFTFPVANYYDRLWAIDYFTGLHTIDERVVATKLDIAVRVNASDYNSGQYGRSFCVDRIIFEPAQN